MSPHLLKVWPTLIGLGLAGILLAGLAQAQSVGRTKAIGSGKSYDMPPHDATSEEPRTTRSRETPRPRTAISDEELQRIKALPGAPLSSSDPVREQKPGQDP